MFKNILIATDGSELAEHAVTNGLSLAKSVGANVFVIVVEAPFMFNVPESRAQMHDAFAKHAEQVRKHATSVLSRVLAAAKLAGVPGDTIQVENEQPDQAIITAAKEKGCDLIVLASHGRNGLSPALLGSVTNKVLTHTNTSVLVCH
jgi:nucleotide-binding universal stress UspA family protein